MEKNKSFKKETNMNSLSLLKQLIALPSYVDSTCNEKSVADFIYAYTKQFDWLIVEKQFITKNRYNIIVKDNYPTKFLFNGHMDTVQKRSGWKTNQLQPIMKGKYLYGLGAADMKGNIAAFLSALSSFNQTKGLMALFYIDEEYDFLGMKQFIARYKNKISPEIIVSGDGTDLKIGNGCRGLIEITALVKGISAHASKPQLGINAITKSISVIEELTQNIQTGFASQELGIPTCNVAFMQGGLDLREGIKDQLLIGREGNNVADIVEFVLDIRTTNSQLTAREVIKRLESFLKKESLTLEKVSIRHDLGAWLTPVIMLKNVEKLVSQEIPVIYADIGNSGFIDSQMLWQTFPNAVCVTLGAGDGLTMHKANERISLDDLSAITQTYQLLIQKLGGGEKI